VYAGGDTTRLFRVMAEARSKGVAEGRVLEGPAGKEIVKNASDGFGLDGLDAHGDLDPLVSAPERNAFHRRDVAVVAAPP
jgi:hypothetical protein